MELERTRHICEIYINGDRTKANISERINEFLKICNLILNFGTYTFHVYCQSCNERLFGEILKLYRMQHPEMIVSIKGKKEPMKKKADFIIIFNWEEEIVAYTKEFMRIKFSNLHNDNGAILDKDQNYDFSKIDLMD